MFDLTQRRRRPELMDDPGLDKKQHILALRGLARLNFWSGSVRILWPAIWELLSESPGQSLRLLDIASGAGDVAVGMWRKAVRAGYSLQIDAWDVSPCAVDYARSEAVAQGAQVRFLQGDALRTPIPNDYDVIVSSLFLHHLDEGPATAFVRRMADAAKRLVLVNDLIRCQPVFSSLIARRGCFPNHQSCVLMGRYRLKAHSPSKKSGLWRKRPALPMPK